MKGQESVSNRCAVGRLMLGTFAVHVDPLSIISDVGKLLNPLPGKPGPIRSGREFATEQVPQGVRRFENQRQCHSCHLGLYQSCH